MPVQCYCSCGHAITAPASQAGQAVLCPRCDREVILPTLAQGPAEALPPVLPVTPADQPVAPPVAKANVPLMVAVVAGLVLLIGGGVTAVLLWNRDKDDSGAPTLRRPADRSQAINNLKIIGVAVHSYHDAYGFLPPPVIREPGKPPRSWRVDILPFMEEAPLYNAWRKDLPFDAPENRKLWDAMPRFYSVPGQTESDKTYVQRFIDTANPDRRWTLSNITDLNGTSNTIMATLAAEPVLWCEPKDLEYTVGPAGFPPSRLLNVKNYGTPTVFCDGQVRGIKKTVSPQVLLQAIRPDNVQPFTLDD
jgi:hypothetical protein